MLQATCGVALDQLQTNLNACGLIKMLIKIRKP
jgi:hypothetical protein